MQPEIRASEVGELTWEMASLYPRQGSWTEAEYLSLDIGRLVEFDHGKLEFLPMPTELHQAIAFFLCLQLKNHVAASSSQNGVAFMAPLRVRVSENKLREPDVLFMLNENRQRRSSRVWDGADLVMEIISDDDPNRDLVTKRTEYAQARIPEYWIIDHRDRSIVVLSLSDGQNKYVEFGRYTEGQLASSELLTGFSVDVTEVFDRPEVTS